MEDFFSLSPEQMTLLATAIGLGISKGYTASEQNIVANFFLQIGQTVSTLAGQHQFLCDKIKEDEHRKYLDKKINLLKNEIELLENKKGD